MYKRFANQRLAGSVVDATLWKVYSNVCTYSQEIE